MLEMSSIKLELLLHACFSSISWILSLSLEEEDTEAMQEELEIELSISCSQKWTELEQKRTSLL